MTAALIVTLALRIIGLNPFSPESVLLTEITDEGNLLAQVLFLGAFGVAMLGAFRNRTVKWGMVPTSLVVLFAWLAVSIIWSDAPLISLRRLFALLVASSTVAMAITILPPLTTLKTLRWFLAIVLVIDLMSVGFVHNAVHHAADVMDPALAGKWKGMHGHKNVAATVAIFGAAIFCASYAVWRKLMDLVLLALALIFLVGTGSKTSLAFGLGCLVLFVVFLNQLARRWDARVASLCILILTVISATALMNFAPQIGAVFEDPQAFTGRVALWTSLLAYIFDHPLLGSGYGGFWRIGQDSPILHYSDQLFTRRANHGHNGFLDIIASTGLVGFSLSIFALIIAPFSAIWKPADSPFGRVFRALAASLLMYVFLHNILESDYLQATRVPWLIWVVAVSLLGAIQREGAEQGWRYQSVGGRPG